MTSEHRSQRERRLDDERCVNALLAEGGFPDDAGLRGVLLQLRSLRVTEVPEPSPEVAALLDRSRDAGVVRLGDWSRRHPRKKRAVFTTLAVAASLGVAGGVAAGNETLRSQAEGTISGIIRSFSPPVPATPEPTTTAPASPPSASLSPDAPKRAPAVVPSPAVPTALTGPVVPAPGLVPGPNPPIPERQGAEAPGRAPQAPPAVGNGAPSTTSQNAVKPVEPGPDRPANLPGRAGEPAAGQAGVPVDGQAKNKADTDGGAEQGAAQPKSAPVQGNGP